MIFEIAQKHINEGVRGRCHSCPVALAIKEQFPHSQVDVYTLEASIGYTCYSLPRKVKRWIHDFDLGRSVQPMSFALNVPAPTGKTTSRERDAVSGLT